MRARRFDFRLISLLHSSFPGCLVFSSPCLSAPFLSLFCFGSGSVASSPRRMPRSDPFCVSRIGYEKGCITIKTQERVAAKWCVKPSLYRKRSVEFAVCGRTAAVQFLAPIGNRRFEYVFLIELAIARCFSPRACNAISQKKKLERKTELWNIRPVSQSSYSRVIVSKRERERFRYPFCISQWHIIIVIINDKNYLPP